jgi:hypothetical protein
MVVYGTPARVTGSVADLAARTAELPRSDRWFTVDGPAWRDRGPEGDEQLGADIVAAFARWRAARDAATGDPAVPR